MDERPVVTPRIEAADDREGWFDGLTGLPGPAFWLNVVAAESARCLRFGRPATIVLVETVGSDEVERAWGRTVVLVDVLEVGQILREGCRASDFVVRNAETRFGILLTETDEVAAINVIERLRARCDATLGSRSVPVRVAFGWASNRDNLPLLDVVHLAEQRLARDH